MATLTPEQAAAIAARGTDVVLAAGAGCGKTFVLTRRYLSHLADDLAEVPRVAAITFTDRAAREMRGRIRAAVRAELAAAAPDSPAARWGRHLRDLDAAPVGTIHSFCGGLLRQYAADAGVDPGFDVLTESLAAGLRARSVAADLDRLLTDPGPAGGDLRELVVLFGWPAVTAALDDLVRDADPAAWMPWVARYDADVVAAWAGREAALRRDWVEYLCAATPKIGGLLARLPGVPAATPEGRAVVAELLAGVPGLATAADVAAEVERLCELAKVNKGGKQAWPDPGAYEWVRDAFAEFRADLKDKLAAFTTPAADADLLAAAAVGRRFLAVARELVAGYAGRKRAAVAIDFQDLIVRARDLLRDHSSVRRRVRERFAWVLVDEVQDTDPVQMELIDLLTTGRGCLFAVGDAKQSIYRFRGADVGLFAALGAAAPPAGRLGLTRNFRSQPGVIAFVNALCGRRIPDYAPLTTAVPQGAAGNVEFLWSVPAADVTGEPAAAVRAREAAAIAGRVVALIDSGDPRVRDGGGFRPVRAGDVVLLFRSMSNVALYEQALRDAGLDYYLVGGRAFYAQQEVADLLNVLRAVENPLDAFSLAGTLRSPFFSVTDETLHLLATHKPGLWAALADPARLGLLPREERAKADHARTVLAGARAVKDAGPVADLVGFLFAATGYDAATQFEPLADRKLANLWKLVDLAREFDRAGAGLAGFLARLADLVRRQPREDQAATLPESADVVRLMTIHQAKGLEFPVVVVPDLAALGRGDAPPVARWDRDWGCVVRVPSDLAECDDEPAPFADRPDRLARCADAVADWREDLRVLYVAGTRARDLLVLSAGLAADLPAGVAGLPTAPPAKAGSHWMLALAERFDLRTGACVAADVPGGVTPAVRVGIVRGADPAAHAAKAHRRSAVGLTPEAAHTETSVPAPPALRAPVGPAAYVPGPAERVVRAVLPRWDLADLDGWRPLLADALADWPTPLPADAAADAQALLEAFAAAPVRRELAAAAECYHAAEVLVANPDPAGPELLEASIDYLARTPAGWQAVVLHLTERPGEHPWDRLRPWAARLAAAAAGSLAAPVGVTLVDLVGGEVWHAAGRRAA